MPAADRQSIPILSDPVARLAELGTASQRRHIIGFSGVPGAGKSTIAARWNQLVADRVGRGAMVVLGMDGFHLSQAELRAMPNPQEAFARRGAPWTFNPGATAGNLRALHEGFGRHAVGWPGFEHDVGDPVEAAIIVEPHVPVIMVEGIYTACPEDGWGSVREQFDEQWYLDVPWEEDATRLVARHMSAWGMTPEEARERADSNDRVNAEVVRRGRLYADWLIRPRGQL